MEPIFESCAHCSIEKRFAIPFRVEYSVFIKQIYDAQNRKIGKEQRWSAGTRLCGTNRPGNNTPSVHTITYSIALFGLSGASYRPTRTVKHGNHTETNGKKERLKKKWRNEFKKK